MKISMSRKEKKNLIRILIALGLFGIIFIVDKIIELGSVFGGEYGWLFPFSRYLELYFVIG